MTSVLAALLAGLALGIWHQASLGPLGLAHPGLGSSGPACLGLGLLVLGRKRLDRGLWAVALAVMVMPLASTWSAWRSPVPGPTDPLRWVPLRHAVVSGIVTSDPRRTERGIRFVVAVDGLLRPFPAHGSGRILVRAESDPPRYGERVHVKGSMNLPSRSENPGEFDYREYLARQGIFAVMTATEVSSLSEEVAPSLVGGAIAFKNAALDLLSRHLPEEQAALLGSLLFGDGASPIDPETAQAFRALGLAHVLAVSGAQILFLWGMLKGFVTRLGLARWQGVMLGVATLWGYALMTGLPPSVVRATWMGCALIIGWAVSRPWLKYLTLEAVALGMLLYRPALLFDAGFQFSAIATFALLHTAPRLAPLFQRLPEALAQTLAMALAAGVWVLPLQIAHFGQVSPYSLPLNAATCLMVEAVTVLGFLAVLGGAVSELLGHHLLGGASLILSAFTGLVELALPLPGSSQYLRIPPTWWLAAAYLCLAFGLRHPPGSGGRDRMRWIVLLLPVLAYGLWDRLDRPRDLEVVFLSIGQGDAIVVRTPSWRWFLIDGGPAWPGGDAGERTILPYLRRQGCKRLDGLILTHAHDDHAGGLASVTGGIPVSAVWDAGLPGGSPAYQRWLEHVLQHRIPLIRVQEGMRAQLDAELELEVLGPPATLHRGSRSDANNNSIVLRLRYRSFSLLLTGDLEDEAERRLLEKPERLRATVLKVAHHGSRYGSGDAFLRAVRPQAAVISVGARNSFRHPAPETVSRLRPYGRIYRTDRHGAVRLRSDGARWSLVSKRD